MFNVIKKDLASYRAATITLVWQLANQTLDFKITFAPRGGSEGVGNGSPKSTRELTLHVGEFIKQVIKYHTKGSVHGVCVITSIGRSLSAGQLSGTSFVDQAPDGYEIRHFKIKDLRARDTVYLTLGDKYGLKSERSHLKTALDASSLVDEAEKKPFLAQFDTLVLDLLALESRESVGAGALAAELIELAKYAGKLLDVSLISRALKPAANRLIAFEQVKGSLGKISSALQDMEEAEFTRLQSNTPATSCDAATIATLRRFIARPITCRNIQLLLTVDAVYAGVLNHCNTAIRLVKYLIASGQNDHLVEVVTRHAVASKLTVPAFMAKFANRFHVLEHAVRCENAWAFEWLTTAAGLDPLPSRLALPSRRSESKSPSTIEALVQAVVNRDAKDAIMRRLQTIHREKAFRELMAEFDTAHVASVRQLNELARNMTRVWDLREVYQLGKTHLTVPNLKALLLVAFQHLLDEELVFGIDASTCFTLALEFCEARGLVVHEQVVRLREQFDLVKQANAPRFRALEQRVRSLELTQQQHQHQLEILQQSFSQLRQYLVNQHVAELHRQQRDRVISLISTALFLVGGPALRLVGDWLDKSQPLHLLTSIVHTGGGSLTRLITDSTATVVYRAGVEHALHRVGVDPALFVKVLRDAVAADMSVSSRRLSVQRWQRAVRGVRGSGPSTRPMTFHEATQLILAQQRCRQMVYGKDDDAVGEAAAVRARRVLRAGVVVLCGVFLIALSPAVVWQLWV